jgi:hypothetical protein
MNRADANVLLANLRRAGNPAAADAKARELAAATVASGAVAALDRRGGVAAFNRIDRTGLGVYRSKAEQTYAARLEAQRAAGLIAGWDYECDRLKLADAAEGGVDRTREKWLLHDFAVYFPGGWIAFDQVKGAWADRAGRDKFRWAMSAYPMRWLRLWRYERGVWTLAVEGGRPEGART